MEVVIEAAQDDLATKRSVFEKVGEVCRSHTTLVCTTGSLSVTQCAAPNGRLADVVRMLQAGYAGAS